ncbi:helix-turn-helix domain-containing protein [Glycomyces xiaoerkulensis]|uniref:helix-turn-helix domain-containing protein n=1 Tax=Glycomyces xiaoerkulensis TaxID=2038139 RepID=UPI001E33B2D8|nr:helix-turn-helix transcriptional regulator [Glycomyces xiaoerkulensis]
MTDRDFGSFISDVRKRAHVSIRQLSDQAGVSNPYLRRERGVRRPSAAVLRQVAAALRMTTPLMYLRAGIGNDEGSATPLAIATDHELTAKQKQTLTEIYDSFVRENERSDSSIASLSSGSPNVTRTPSSP